jgi:predicted nucleic acid-binding protein
VVCEVDRHGLSVASSAISSMFEAELRFGMALQREATRLKLLVEEPLCRVEILPWTSGSAFHYAHQRAALDKASSCDR